MNIRKLVNIPIRVRTPSREPVPGEPKLSSTESEKSQGVFLTAQSLITFPGATAAVLLFWRVAMSLLPTWASSLWIPFGLSLLAGAIIWWLGVSDPKTTYTPRDKKVAVIIAAINSMQVFAAVIGIPK